MRVLALDAAGLTCSAALLEGGECLAERAGLDSRRATTDLPVIAAALLAEFGAGLDAVAVTVGPGSFTGLRGALALAHGLALGAGVPVVGVTVAEALLQGASASCPIASGAVWVALDARRPGRIFLDTGSGMAGRLLEALPLPPGPVLVLGDAALAVCAAVPGAVAGENRTVSAAAVGRVALRRLVGELGPCSPQPLYIEAPAAREQA